MSRQPTRRLVLASLPLSVTVSSCSGEDRTEPQDPGSSTENALAARTTGMPLVAESGGVQVQVDGSAPLSRRQDYLTRSLAAVDPVEQVWGRGALPERVQVTAPATSSEFTDLADSRADVPAVTRPDRGVVLHPDLWTRTRAAGREVVLRHEFTHVALDQGEWRQVPRWVVEGSAEVTAYRDEGLAPAQVAPGVAKKVGAGRGPTGPPTDDQVAAEDGYGLAWAWCSFLIAQNGWPVFVRFVRAVGREPSRVGTGRAFRTAYRSTPKSLAADYSTWLASWV